jgi:hypothetical protein
MLNKSIALSTKETLHSRLHFACEIHLLSTIVCRAYYGISKAVAGALLFERGGLKS